VSLKNLYLGNPERRPGSTATEGESKDREDISSYDAVSGSSLDDAPAACAGRTTEQGDVV